MTRLIDADALSKDLEKRWDINDDQDFCNKEVWYALDDAPTIDAVEVVRCKDCKHQEHCHETVAHTRLHDGFKEYWLEPIEWCSRGERKGGKDE